MPIDKTLPAPLGNTSILTRVKQYYVATRVKKVAEINKLIHAKDKNTQVEQVVLLMEELVMIDKGLETINKYFEENR